MSTALNVMRNIGHHIKHYAQFPALFSEILPFENGYDSCRKSRLTVILDILYCFLILKMVPRNYYLFGFHAKDRHEFKEYMDEPNSPVFRRKLCESLWPADYSSLVNDKYIFHCLCRYNQIPVPEIYGIYREGAVGLEKRKLEDVMDAFCIDRAILKPVHGMQGRGIYFVLKTLSGVTLKPAFPEKSPAGSIPPKEKFIIQELITQHPELNRINPSCLNTIRIISLLMPDNNVKILAAMLRTNAKDLAIDNFSLGGVVVGINLDAGTLKEKGFMRGTKISTITHHPITGLQFFNFCVPYWNEMKELVIRAQKIFGDLKTVGWDIAVGPKGPIMIEGNIEWGTSGIQAANGGLLTPEIRVIFKRYGVRFHG